MTTAPLTAPRGVDEADADDRRLPPIRRVVLIDPREERRAITNRLVTLSSALTVVGLAGSLDEAEAQIDAEHADVALLEIQMPVTQGLVAIGALRSRFPDLRIVVLSFHADRATREAARSHGADGYLTKPLQIEDLVALVSGPAVAPPAEPGPSRAGFGFTP